MGETAVGSLLSCRMEEEIAPLIEREDFRSLSQPRPESVVVQCCCVESTRLGKVPIIRTLFKKQDPSEKGTFSSSFGVLFSMLGSVVGTGNIWRFPRILANNAAEGGGLAFLLVWFLFLWIWSLPLILLEYGVGRFTKKAPVESFGKLIGPSYRFMGAFPAMISIFIGSYYSVLVGWCGYYFIYSCANTLPQNSTSSEEIWDNLQDSHWPVVFHGISMLIAGLTVVGGVATIEPVNKIMVPTLLAIVTLSFYWAIFLPSAADGITYMFRPNWTTLKSSTIWLEAIAQNAWDTGGGSGAFLTYASFMKRTQGAVRLGTITPLCNNVVSLMCGILIFSTVFSVQGRQGATENEILMTLGYNGPGNSGLTFIWMPLLYASIQGGKVLAILFFLCITFAGLSSLISIIERPVHVLADFGVRRVPATIFVTIFMFLVGTASAVDASVLVNQDKVWGYALILSGCFMLFLVIRYGPLKFRRDLFTDYGIGDWPLPILWVLVIVFISPIEGVGLIVWWIVEQIKDNPGTWWQITIDSLATVLMEWVIVLAVAIGLNWWLSPLAIHKPKNRTLARVLGFFFVLRPPKMFVPPTPSIHTPEQLDSGSDGETNSFALSKKSIMEKRRDMTFAHDKIVTSGTDL